MYKKQIILIGLILIVFLTALLALSSEAMSQIAFIENEHMWSEMSKWNETPNLDNDYKIVSGSTISRTFHQDNPANDIWVETLDVFEKKEQAGIGASHIIAMHTETSFDDERYDEVPNFK